jgi:hypothetical protein
MTLCPVYWQLYRALCALSRQLTPADGDWLQVTYLAMVDRERPDRQAAADALRMHAKDCTVCKS